MKQLIGMEILPTSCTLALLGLIAAATFTMVQLLVRSAATSTMVGATTALRGVGFVWRNRAKRFALSESVI